MATHNDVESAQQQPCNIAQDSMYEAEDTLFRYMGHALILWLYDFDFIITQQDKDCLMSLMTRYQYVTDNWRKVWEELPDAIELGEASGYIENGKPDGDAVEVVNFLQMISRSDMAYAVKILEKVEVDSE